MPPKTKVPIDKVISMYNRGLSGREIAHILGLPKSTVLAQIKRLGISRPNIQHHNKTGHFCTKNNTDKSLPNSFAGKTHSGETKRKIADAHKGMWAGDKNPNYGDNARRLQEHPQYETGIGCYRKIAMENKEWKCSICCSADELIVHHINGDRKNNDVNNLFVLCRSCHAKIHETHALRIRNSDGKFI